MARVRRRVWSPDEVDIAIVERLAKLAGGDVGRV
jgi:hypothetical protein